MDMATSKVIAAVTAFIFVLLTHTFYLFSLFTAASKQYAFSAFTLLVGRQEEYPTCNNEL